MGRETDEVMTSRRFVKSIWLFVVSLQLTVTGVPGKGGVPVTCPVLVAFRSECEDAPIQHLIMAVETAVEHRNRHKLVIHSPAQVNSALKIMRNLP